MDGSIFGLDGCFCADAEDDSSMDEADDDDFVVVDRENAVSFFKPMNDDVAALG